MSDTVLFAIGCVIFALTVVGAVMAGGFWFGRIQEATDDADRPWRPLDPDSAARQDRMSGRRGRR